jgi:hypothetical protein
MSHCTPLVTLGLRFWNEQQGAILSAELVFVMTLVVIGSVVGLSKVRIAVTNELSDIASAVGSLNQSLFIPGLRLCGAAIEPSNFTDENDVCDCEQLELRD